MFNTVDHDFHSGDAAIFNNEICCGGPDNGLDTEVEQRFDNRADQCAATTAQIVVYSALKFVFFEEARTTAECCIGDFQVRTALTSPDFFLPWAKTRVTKKSGVK